MATSLCSSCESITLDGCGFLGTKPHHRIRSLLTKLQHFGHTVESIRINGGSCDLCGVLHGLISKAAEQAALDSKTWVQFQAHTKEWHLMGSAQDRDAPFDSYLVALSIEAARNRLGVLRLYTQGDEQLDWLIPGKPVRLPESSEGVALVQKWMLDCMRNHTRCRVGLSGTTYSHDVGSPLPTRLIDVGDSDNGPRLTTGHVGNGLYTALSYCWGDASTGFVEDLQLQRHNLHSLTVTLPLDRCPKTITDAITTSQRLGFRYIWIDRLCIVQDDAEDWKEQASQMGEIYQGAALTIVALGARNTMDGCYLQRITQPSATIPCMFNGQRLGNICLAPILDNQGLRSHFDLELKHARWNDRGWTFQERLLSRRTIHYGAHQLYWECQEAMRQECEEFTYRGWYNESQDLSALLKVTTMEGILRAEDQVESIVRGLGPMPGLHRAITAPDSLRGTALRRFTRLLKTPSVDHTFPWNDLVVEYASRSLTYPSDRPTAIQGLAQMVSERTKEQCVAGLWLNDLQRGFFWAPKGPPSQRPAGMVPAPAPSWSWLSFDGPVASYSHMMSGRNFKTTRTAATQSQDHYLRGLQLDESTGLPSLHFEAFVFPAKRSDRGLAVWPQALRDAIDRKLDAGFMGTLSASFLAASTYTLLIDDQPIGRVHFDYDTDPPESFHCIVLFSSSADTLVKGTSTDSWRLLIVEVMDEKTMKCKRIGIGIAMFWKSVNFGMRLDRIWQKSAIHLC